LTPAQAGLRSKNIPRGGTPLHFVVVVPFHPNVDGDVVLAVVLVAALGFAIGWLIRRRRRH
jgi:hypothetical protein